MCARISYKTLSLNFQNKTQVLNWYKTTVDSKISPQRYPEQWLAVNTLKDKDAEMLCKVATLIGMQLI